MKIISVWNPWASLIVTGHKTIETRGWSAPTWLIGQRIGIAATKILKREQLVAYGEPSFQLFYRSTGLPDVDELPRGALIGTAILRNCERMTQEMIEAVHPRELAFGVWSTDRFAWFLTEPIALREPIPARGAQGLWDYHGVLNDDKSAA